MNNEGTQASAPQLFIVEFDLNELSSHFFNQVLGFKRAAEERGWTPRILLGKDVAPALADPLQGHRLIEPEATDAVTSPRQADGFAKSDQQLQSLWNAIEAMAVSSRDIVLITSSRPVVVYSLGAWLNRLGPEQRPAVFIRFFSHEYLDLKTMHYNERSSLHRFAARDLSLKPGQERVFFTVNNEKMIAPLAQLCARRVFQMPLPKYYGEVPASRRANEEAPAIYAHLNMRSGVMLDQIKSAIHTVLDKHPRAKFLLKYCENAIRPGSEGRLSRALIARGIELVPPEQTHADHMSTIERSDIVFLPYEATEYAALASGVFAEAAALGKVIVYPDNTWMAEQVAHGYAVGVGFAAARHAETSVAVIDALDALAGLSTAAAARSHDFRALHSCERNLDLMAALAADKHDMLLRSAPGSQIKFDKPLQSRGYLGFGWSSYEPRGVWTDGASAEVSFFVAPQTAGPLDVHLRLTPFLSKGRPQAISVSVGGVELCKWNLPYKRARNARWCSLRIPLPLAANGEIRLQLHVKDPHSPKQAGMSDDERALGVMLHEMRLGRRWRLLPWSRQTARIR